MYPPREEPSRFRAACCYLSVGQYVGNCEFQFVIASRKRSSRSRPTTTIGRAIIASLPSPSSANSRHRPLYLPRDTNHCNNYVKPCVHSIPQHLPPAFAPSICPQCMTNSGRLPTAPGGGVSGKTLMQLVSIQNLLLTTPGTARAVPRIFW